MPIFCTLRQTFTPQKASQNVAVGRERSELGAEQFMKSTPEEIYFSIKFFIITLSRIQMKNSCATTEQTAPSTHLSESGNFVFRP